MKSPLVRISLVALIFAIGFFGTWPGYQTFMALRRELIQKEEELRSAEKYSADLHRASQTFQTLQPQLERLHFALPSFPSIPSLYNLIGDLGSTSGLLLNTIASTQATGRELAVPRLRVVEVSATFEGSYESMKKFLENAKNAPRFLRVESVSFGAPEDGVFAFHIRLSAFSY
ncbi:MAG: type 4a pilus biogenesis protein PilO [Candidatus Wildermuthbacteria bacterium]|nr:type 4a pilus biogenesis protein PilO [Candidatus Wildermuthbacteria bacterium]